MSTLQINTIRPYLGDTIIVEGILSSSVIDNIETTIEENSASFSQRINDATNEQDLSSFETKTTVSDLSSSLYTRNGGQDTLIQQNSASAWGAFQSASSYSASFATTNGTTQTTISNLSSSAYNSYAKLGSVNTFIGNQTITGSLYISANLIVQGSSSIQTISSSTLNIGTNLVTVNVQNPSSRFGGLAVIDSGSSPQRSGSLLFDATENEWLVVHQNASTITSSLLIMGPETYNNVGNEIHLTNNRIVKSVNDEHIGDSNINDNGTTITMLTNTDVTGSLKVTTSVSASTFTGVGNLTTFSASLSSRSITNANSADGAFASASAYSSSLNSRITSVSASFASVVSGLPTSDVISRLGVANPSNFTLYSFPTSSYKGANLTFSATEAGGENSSGRSTTYNILIAQGNNLVTNIQTYQIKSQTSSPAPNITTVISGGNVLIRITDSGTFNYTGYINLF